jgi:hypothetical protein
MASADGTTGVDHFRAIKRCLSDLERRGVDTANVTTFRFRRDGSGDLIAEPRVTVAAALLKTRLRRLRDQRAQF